MESLYKVLLVTLTFLCSAQLTVSQDTMVLTSQGGLDLYRLLVSEQCSSYWGCNLKHTRCKEYPEGCGDNFKNCQCKDGYTLVAGVCKKFRKVKSSCKEEEHICPHLSTCTNGKCECPNDVYSDNKEVCGRRYKEACTQNSDCNLERGNQTCQESKCMCAKGLDYVKKHGRKCLPKSGGSCTSRYDCYGEQLCTSGICKCQTGLKWDDESYRCVGSNAMLGISRGDECTLDHRHINAKVCTYGHICFPCNPGLQDYRCVRFPTSGVTKLQLLSPLLLLLALTSTLVF